MTAVLMFRALVQGEILVEQRVVWKALGLELAVRMTRV